ncbi:hypothetical protein DXQ21_00195 [Listeria monocytogenes]|nr:hypothetical protein [Listeria monocytogenes]
MSKNITLIDNLLLELLDAKSYYVVKLNELRSAEFPDEDDIKLYKGELDYCKGAIEALYLVRKEID